MIVQNDIISIVYIIVESLLRGDKNASDTEKIR